MQKYFSLLALLCITMASLAPTADASVRLRKSRFAPVAPVYNPYYPQPVYQNVYQPTYQNSTNTYYYSPNSLPGYTYYSSPTPGYYLYTSSPVTTTSDIQQGRYNYSPNYISGYTYYSSPTAGYYQYLGTTPVQNNYNTVYPYNYNNNYNNFNNSNMICTIVNGSYQCNANSYGANFSTYPGCSTPDIVIGGQVWASCNAVDRGVGSTSKTGWFFAGDRESSFTSYNGANSALEWMGKQTREKSLQSGPCAAGYRLPTQGEWNTLQSYARAGNTTIANLISLGQNGSYQGSRNTAGDVSITGRLSPVAAYWSSTNDGGTPIVMHIGSTYAGYNTTGTDYGYVNNGYNWTYNNNGLELVRSTTGELANVRCIK